MESSFDCYTPLERPVPQCQPAALSAAPVSTEREDGECDTDSDSENSSCDSDDSNTRRRSISISRPKRPPVPPAVPAAAQPPAPNLLAKKKYNIWTEKIREDSLTETMRNCGVNREGGEGRHVEWYDHTLGNRFGKDGQNRLKRRRHSGAAGGGRRRESNEEDLDDVDLDGEDSLDMYHNHGKRVCHNKSKQNKARLLDDLEAAEDASLEDVAKEIARNLKESNEALIVQVTTVFGRELVQGIYRETQRIEEDGGMMIRNNRRRRTSGGVFLFLVKHNDEVTEEQKREAFKDPAKESVEDSGRKRDEEIEELKKTLITQDSPKLRPRVDAIQMCSTLSNPPPSPVATPPEDDVGAGEEEDLNNNSSAGPANDHMDFN